MSLTFYVDGREKRHVQHELQVGREPHLERLAGRHGGGGAQRDGAGGQEREPAVVRVTVVGQRHGQYPAAATGHGTPAAAVRAHQTPGVVHGQEHLRNGTRLTLTLPPQRTRVIGSQWAMYIYIYLCI